MNGFELLFSFHGAGPVSFSIYLFSPGPPAAIYSSNMVNAGRVACIFTPFVLSIIAFICLVYIWLGGTNSSNRTFGDVYFLQVRIYGTEHTTNAD